MNNKRTAIDPMTGKEIHRKKSVFTYGLTDEEFLVVEGSLPNKDIEVCDCTDCFTDIIALPHIALIMNPDIMSTEHIDYFNSYTEDVGVYPEKYVFIRENSILDRLSPKVKYTVYNSDIDFEDKLKYILLDAVKTDKHSESYSDTIAQTIRVLSEIRKNPGITTAQLAKIIERSPRTVQRYITTLNCAGEFIEYDQKKKGWFLFENKSTLWGDY